MWFRTSVFGPGSRFLMEGRLMGLPLLKGGPEVVGEEGRVLRDESRGCCDGFGEIVVRQVGVALGSYAEVGE
jgi:hypothetical protein